MSATVTAREYARRLALSDEERNSEIARLRRQPEALEAGSTAGISVIIPTYQGVGRLEASLRSLEAQSFPKDRFEVIVVPNGPDDGSITLLKLLTQELEQQVRVLKNPVASAGAARNLALAAARYDHITFVDDDDTVEPRFLEGLWKAAKDGDISLAPIVNLRPDGEVEPSNSLADRIEALRGKRVPAREVPWALGFNACKLLPTNLARRVEYKSDLRSGEDLVYFANILTEPNAHISVVGPGPDMAYRRTLRDDSVSRRQGTFEFLVSERIACIRELERTRAAAAKVDAPALSQLMRAQQGFITRYARENEGGREEILSRLADEDRRHLPWAALNNGLARDLAFAYCFMPYSDTSGVVAGKAIAERGKIVDLISNNMFKVRRVDESLRMLSDPWVDQHVVVDTPASFADWAATSRFAEAALASAEKSDAQKGPYETVYSRALWIGSHVAAALFKLRHWNVKWTAEFSDPLRMDAAGQPRKGNLVENEVSQRLRQGLTGRGFGNLLIDSSFDLVEASTMVLADDLVFTNANQLDYMLSLYPDQHFRQMVRDKARVRPHPTPEPALYDVSPTSYEVPSGVVNIAYFGSFYPNRGIGEVFTALQNVPLDVKRSVRFHIFCNNPKVVTEQISQMRLTANVYVNPYLDYLEFLNATRLFDVLLVNDVIRDENLPVNPFLPSKLSDYRGAGRKIWALVDDGSPMALMTDLDHVSPAGNIPRIADTLTEIVRGLSSVG